MKKVIINTMQDNNNIGNRLQNFALQEVLQKFNVDVVNLDNGFTRKTGKKEGIKILFMGIFGFLGHTKCKIEFIKFYNHRRRRLANEEFSRTYIHNIIRVTYKDVFHMNWEDYDLAIVGSDQVWHKWRGNPLELPYYYLEFLPKIKRNSYAASFGFEEFPEEDKEQHMIGLRGMRNISCREKTGCCLVESITNKEVPQVLDPTLLLSVDDWRKMETDISAVIEKDEHYIFLYFLGEITEEYKKSIEIINCNKNLKIINFLDFTNTAISECSVREFITFIDRADYVLTDSFHCTVFSIIFDKEFTVFCRVGKGFEKMYSRIEDLLRITGKTSNSYCKVEEKDDALSFQDMYDKSYEYIRKILMKEC